jgi:RHS repeat-associated protein
MPTRHESSAAYRYGFNGKELENDTDLDVYDYGARFYNSAVPFFWSIDPKADKYTFQSPYVYAQNNPVLYMDINGEGTEENEWKREIGEDGKVSYTAEKGDSAYSLYTQYGATDRFTAKQANDSVESQLGINYEIDGKVYSNVEVGDVVEIQSENYSIIENETFIKYPKNYDININKIDSINDEIDFRYKTIDNYYDVMRDEEMNGSQEGPHNIGVLIALLQSIHDERQKINNDINKLMSLKKRTKPDTFNYQIIRILPNSSGTEKTIKKLNEFQE